MAEILINTKDFVDLYMDIYIYIAYNIYRIYLQMLHFLDSMSL